MKYSVARTNNLFAQIIGTSETGKTMEYPVAFQVRGDDRVLETIAKAIERYLERVDEIDQIFHDDAQARYDFENGFIISEIGEHPVVIIGKNRSMSMMIGHQQFGDGPVQEPANLLEAIHEAINKPARKAKIGGR